MASILGDALELLYQTMNLLDICATNVNNIEHRLEGKLIPLTANVPFHKDHVPTKERTTRPSSDMSGEIFKRQPTPGSIGLSIS